MLSSRFVLCDDAVPLRHGMSCLVWPLHGVQSSRAAMWGSARYSRYVGSLSGPAKYSRCVEPLCCVRSSPRYSRLVMCSRVSSSRCVTLSYVPFRFAAVSIGGPRRQGKLEAASLFPCRRRSIMLGRADTTPRLSTQNFSPRSGFVSFTDTPRHQQPGLHLHRQTFELVAGFEPATTGLQNQCSAN